ncbi:MAG: redoxin domain-containing protein, partial [Planctomycetota bacterium]
MVAQNEKLFSLIKMDYTVKKSTSIPTPELLSMMRKDLNIKIEESGVSYKKVTWAQDNIKQYLKFNTYSDSNEWTYGYVSAADGEILKEGYLPDLMYGYIANATDFPWGSLELTYLGLRPLDKQRKLSEYLVEKNASFDGAIETIDGRETYVVDIKSTDASFFERVWIDCERGMPLKTEFYKGHPNSSQSIMIGKVKSIELYQLPNGGWFPAKGTRIMHIRSAKPFLDFSHFTVDVNSITTKREDIPDSLFTIEFPEGAEVHNAITGTKIKVARKLLGKSLPKFEEMEFTFTEEKIKGKKLVICFWDMDQRPSRNCLIQLSKRANELKTKDVVVVAIQGSKVDKDKLNEWIKENDMTFPVGMIQGNEEKIRFTWGVRSLPWLILTDKGSIV